MKQKKAEARAATRRYRDLATGFQPAALRLAGVTEARDRAVDEARVAEEKAIEAEGSKSKQYTKHRI